MINIDEIKNASTYKDFIMPSIEEIIDRNIAQSPMDIFAFPPFRSDKEENEKKDLFNDIDYDSEEFDKLKKIKIDLNLDITTIRENLNKIYPNEGLIREKPKYSASEIKQQKKDNINSYIKSREYTEQDLEDYELAEDLVNDKDRVDGTELGTAIHSLMEHFNFESTIVADNKKNIGATSIENVAVTSIENVAVTSIENVRATNIENVGAKFYEPVPMNNIIQAVDSYQENINKLLSSDLGKALAKAQKNNKLYREQRFMIELPLSTIKEYMGTLSPSVETNHSKSARVILQGVIDAFYINDNDNIVLIDYKTDGLINKKVTKKQLIDNYKIQMDLYEKALTQILEKKVEKRIIYSFALNEAIEL